MSRTAQESLRALRSGTLALSAVLCASCAPSLATEDGLTDNGTTVVDCASDAEHAQSTTAVRLRIVGRAGGSVSAATLKLGSRQFTSDESGERILIGPSLMTENFLRLDLLRPTGGFLARVEAKLAGQIQGWPVDRLRGPAAPQLAGYLTYNHQSHPLWCRFREQGT